MGDWCEWISTPIKKLRVPMEDDGDDLSLAGLFQQRISRPFDTGWHMGDPFSSLVTEMSKSGPQHAN
jgi:hypothetical protein